MDVTSRQLDAAFRILADGRRRAVLARLAAADWGLTLNDLAKEIAGREREAEITEIDGGALTRIYLSLLHVHVPMLADGGFVEYDRERGIVAPAPRLDALEPYLSAIGDGSVDGTWQDDQLAP